ncbi:cysteine desulfurase family protein [Paenibacillus sacheonensis]|uniref:cysteine desulfurase n=1 Tax=Paenibacillus sacheonensis TaxID=742054 RepID=A0A7X5BZ69_9BACL|nr:cysteine desulfurase family protein [Paenibacillus sacheonensis]MBM7563724.1 cysteine desulfurase [Paenibacillus sacheonensis]NBC67920.1 aminotransferase class V-fold PLP-dependent enzyme [Paenibacillus sacheonensis]
MERIYYDHAATSPMHPDAAAAMMDVYTGTVGNASSIHGNGRSARGLLNRSRDLIAGGIGCTAAELVFTSGGTESDNMAIIGVARAARKRGKSHIITLATEHHAVLHACESLESEGFRLSVLPVNEQGTVNVQHIADAIADDTALISVMYVNNETGTIQPIAEIGELARSRGVLFHVDAVQALGVLPIDLRSLPVDLMSFSAHKINGPQGVGALFVRKGTVLVPLLHGGSQERKRRPGTENVAGIAAFAAAFEHSVNSLANRKPLLDKLRYTWIERMIDLFGEEHVVVNGHPAASEASASHIVNLSFPGISSETMLMNLDLAGIAASSGSACTAGALEPSHVLEAMGISRERLESAVRFSFGLGNTMEELECAAKKIATFTSRIRTNA